MGVRKTAARPRLDGHARAFKSLSHVGECALVENAVVVDGEKARLTAERFLEAGNAVFRKQSGENARHVGKHPVQAAQRTGLDDELFRSSRPVVGDAERIFGLFRIQAEQLGRCGGCRKRAEEHGKHPEQPFVFLWVGNGETKPAYEIVAHRHCGYEVLARCGHAFAYRKRCGNHRRARMDKRIVMGIVVIDAVG